MGGVRRASGSLGGEMREYSDGSREEVEILRVWDLEP